MQISEFKSNFSNHYKKFVLKVFLKHLVWMVPMLLFCFSKSLVLGICFICFIVSFTYWEFEKYKLPFKLKMHITSSTIKTFYNLSIWPLFFLTGWAIFEGIKNNYTTGDDIADYIFPVIYAIGLTSILVALTHMIKTGKQWVLLAIIYIVFDFPGAMPYNYLFFYEKLKAQNGFDVDYQNYKVQMDTTIAFISPLIASTNRNIITTRNEIETKISNAVNQAKIYSDKTNKIIVPNVKVPATLGTKLNNFIADSIYLYRFAMLENVWTNNIADLSKSRKDRIMFMNEFKQDLNSFTNSLTFNSADSISKRTIQYLKISIKEIDKEQKTQLEAIQDLFIYSKSLLGINSLRPLSKEDEEFIEMCLLPSIIIDLLPLLFSIIYAKWNETKETLEK